MKERTKSAANESGRGFEITSAGLHIIAMLSMLIDHTMKTMIESDSWVFVLGRLAFPIFAFMAAEGYVHTHNYRKYILRVLVFAVLSEVPYDLMKSATVFDMYDQNVLWTFLLALLCIWVIDCVKSKGNKAAYIFAAIGISLAGMLLGVLFMVDYSGLGVCMVLIFYLFRERKWWNMLIQFVLMLLINVVALGAFDTEIALTMAGVRLEIPLQGFAVLALIPIWLYRGRQGYHSKPFQYLCYAFYPVHMLILYML